MTQQKAIEDYVREYVDKNCSEKKNKKLWLSKTIIEVACECADEILNDRHPNTQHTVLHKSEDCLRYTEESQELFNEYYDDVMSHLENKTLK